MSDVVHEKIDSLVKSNPVVLFMKGNRNFPQCGFSATVVKILNQHLSGYETVNVLSDAAIREGVKAYAQWPTIPQLYVNGEFVGGCDIIRELDGSGELAKMLATVPAAKPAAPAAPVKEPSVTVTPAAAAELVKAAEGNGDALHVEISGEYAYDLFFGPKQPGEREVKAGALTLVLDAASYARADGLRIDFVTGPDGQGFKIESPNEPARVQQIAPTAVRALLATEKDALLVDVRTVGERAKANIEGSQLLDAELEKALEAAPKDKPLVFFCHHGGRSQRAAEQFVSRGFKKVYNVVGGIDAWSQSVDPSVARY